MEGYTGIIPYLCGVIRRAKRQSGFRRLSTKDIETLSTLPKLRMKTCEDLKGVLNVIGSSKVVEVFMVSPTPTFCLPWDSSIVKRRSSVIITKILEPDTIREPRSKTVIQLESQPLRGDESHVEISSQDDVCYVP
ncbi:Uncharacterized protein Fot_23093 [Forsythia ovata]|uniref:Uncharacterized protein n=1 Tax=Forsythia ovata TaxID=205694 RepID=A0ABD1UZK6_9LAMI